MLMNFVLKERIILHNNKGEKVTNKGNISRGVVKKSNNQVKKHITQMSSEEINFLEKALKGIDVNRISYSSHLEEKDIAFNKDYITEILESDYAKEMIVEYNETTMRDGRVDRRVLLRDSNGRNVSINNNEIKKANLCVVLSLDSSRLITAYWNKVGDSHHTMDWKRYNQDLSIC